MIRSEKNHSVSEYYAIKNVCYLSTFKRVKTLKNIVIPFLNVAVFRLEIK